MYCNSIAATAVLLIPPFPLQPQFARLVARHERLRAAQRKSLRQTEPTRLQEKLGGVSCFKPFFERFEVWNLRRRVLP